MIHFLIVDDDALDREAVTRALHTSFDQDCTMSEVKTGSEALAFLKKHSPDCILLDYRLPDLDGLKLLENILQTHTRLPIPVVMLTGEGNEMIAVKAMKMGVFDYIPKESLSPPLLAGIVHNAIEKFAMQKELEQAKACLEQMALYDCLTGLGNRNLFNSQLERCIGVAGRNKQRFCLLVMDLNRFKEINDTLGHQAGDQVLIEVGLRLKKISRAADLIFRLGGDEFALLLETGATEDGARTMSKKIIEVVKQPMHLSDQVREVGISIGIALFPDHGLNADTLFNQADAAMYAAKRHGGGFSLAPTWEK